MACSCESGAAPKALAVPQYDTDQEPMLEPKVVQLPGLQQTLRPGEELLPYGLFLPATGQILGLQAHECGNSFIPLQGIPEELLNPYEESMGSWLSDDMRLCGCSGTSRDPVKAEDVLQALKAEATRTNRPAPIRTGAEGWSDSMRGLRSGARQAPRGSAARQEDEPHRGSRGDIEREVPYEWEEPDDGTRTLPRDCVSSATVEPDDVRELRNICKINLGHSGLLGRELEVKIPSGYTASRSRGEMKEAYLSDWLDLCVPAGASDWSQANRALLYNSEKNPGLFWNSEKGYYHGFLLHAIRTVYGCRGVLGESSFKSDLGVYLDKCKMAPSDLRSLENEGKTWLVSNGVLCGGNKRYIQVDAQGVVKISGGGGVANHQAYASLGKVWLCPRQVKYRAALADYYLWWAWRAYSRAMDMRDRGDSDYLFTWYVGLMCARCALAEIVAVSALLIHELGHVFGNSYHCRDNSDEALGGFLAGLWVALSFGTGPGAIVIPLIGAWIGSKLWGDGSKKDCCQYVIEFAFWARLTGRFGLPAIPHLVNLSGNDIATDRFAAGGAVFSVSFGMGAGCEESGASLAYWELTSILVPDAPVNFTWGVRSKCDSTGLSSPATVVL